MRLHPCCNSAAFAVMVPSHLIPSLLVFCCVSLGGSQPNPWIRGVWLPTQPCQWSCALLQAVKGRLLIKWALAKLTSSEGMSGWCRDGKKTFMLRHCTGCNMLAPVCSYVAHPLKVPRMGALSVQCECAASLLVPMYFHT